MGMTDIRDPPTDQRRRRRADPRRPPRCSRPCCATCATPPPTARPRGPRCRPCSSPTARPRRRRSTRSCKRKRAISEHEKEHGEEEHAEGNEALLALLECKGTDTQKFDDAVEELATALNHHIGEEEQTILNPAREEVSQEVREELGVAWPTRRNELLDEDCRLGAANVRRIVETRAHEEGAAARHDEDEDE